MKTQERVRECYGGEDYEYYPLGKHVVAAPGVCGGRPTFKYTRIEAASALRLVAAGHTIEAIARRFEVPPEAVEEAIRLAAAHLEAWTIPA
jgi:uncharacterized protein (DUF433 family)